MRFKGNFLIVGLVCLILFSGFITLPWEGFKEFNSMSASDTSNLPSVDPTVTDNDSGCASVIVNVKPGFDVVSYRRDSNNSADTIIDKTNFTGQNSFREYKTQGGNFTHIIITETGWIICIGGKDGPDTNKKLIKLASDIISRGNIQKEDLEKAHSIIKSNKWGHFMIKSPDDTVGVTAYDFRNLAITNMSEMVKMKDGDYVKITNNPRFYAHEEFNKITSNPVDAAIRIVGEDPYGLVRRDVTTYQYTNIKNTTKVDSWASFDGGAMLTGAHGYPDDIVYFGKVVKGNELPTIPDKKYLGQEILRNSTTSDAFPTSTNLGAIIATAMIGALAGFFIFRYKQVKK